MDTQGTYIKIVLSTLVLSIFSAIFLHGQESMSIDIGNDIVLPRQYVIHHATEKIIIDGKAHEKDWQNAQFSENFIDIQGVIKPQFDTKVKMLWSEEFLFIYAQLEEPHIAANLVKHDTVIFYDKDFEIFIDPTDDTYQYIEIEVNALNTTWDLYLDKPYRNGGKALNAFEIKGFESAVGLHGTLNNANDIDTMWTVEMAIPIDVILEVGHKKRKKINHGDYWRMNFSRVHWDQQFINGKYHSLRDDENMLLKEYNWVWSNQGVINMHEPEKWGYVFFTSNPSTTPNQFNRPANYLDKQIAYACYRKTRYKKWKYLQKKPPGFSQAFKPIRFDDQTYDVTFFKTHGGFDFVIQNNTTNIRYSIDEMGHLKKIK